MGVEGVDGGEGARAAQFGLHVGAPGWILHVRADDGGGVADCGCAGQAVLGNGGGKGGEEGQAEEKALETEAGGRGGKKVGGR